jgi:hypothetical protein
VKVHTQRRLVISVAALDDLIRQAGTQLLVVDLKGTQLRLGGARRQGYEASRSYVVVHTAIAAADHPHEKAPNKRRRTNQLSNRDCEGKAASDYCGNGWHDPC